MCCLCRVASANWREIDLSRAVRNGVVSRIIWEGESKRVKAPYAKELHCVDLLLKYGGTREILSESGGTTLQG